MKNIHTLVSDIYDVIGTNGFPPDIAEGFSREVGLKLVETTGPRDKIPTLSLSQMGPKCPKQLWHTIRTPELALPLKPWTKLKFQYGHILESLLIALSKASGHEVTGEQDELYVDGIVGHRDCVIDGNIVDVKSVNSRSFEKFKDGSIAHNDLFGYLDQLDGYVVGSHNDPLVRNKTSGFLLVVDQELGHLKLYEHIAREESIRQRIRDYRHVVSLDRPPACTCETVPDGKSGNIRLGTVAKYNAFRHQCFPQLRTFLYSDGPRFLSTVIRRPTRADGSLIPEINKDGQFIY